MRVLITGFLGLVGHEITSQFTAAGHNVLGVDDLSHNAVPFEQSVAKGWLPRPVHELPSYYGFGPAHVAHWPELVIHCASPVGHARLVPEAHVAWQIVRDTQAILDLCAKTRARLITFSSSEVLTYRGETDIRAQYALGKLTAESMVLGHPSVQGRLIRPYNVTGRHQRADGGFVMPRFRDAVLEGRPLTIFGSGEQIRHFTHVSDFARFVLLLAEKWPAPRRWCVFNPANRITINGLARLFHAGRLVPGQTERVSDPAILLGNPFWRDSSERPLDIGEHEACQKLGWQPQVTLEQIVREHLTGRFE